MERRKSPRKPAFQTQTELTVSNGRKRFPGRLIDSSENGLSIESNEELEQGILIKVTGIIATGISLRKLDFSGTVIWCKKHSNGTFRAGLQRVVTAPSSDEDLDDEPDYYDILQISHNAEAETVNRVFRLLASRYHPDNSETGDVDSFKLVVKAHEVLSNPESRAAFDARRAHRQQSRWRIFESPEASRGVEAEKRKRHKILALLYVQRMNEPRSPGVALHELENLLGCPKEHLEFALWFLRENLWVYRSDNGRLSITAKGVEKAEVEGAISAESRVGEDRMIEAPA